MRNNGELVDIKIDDVVIPAGKQAPALRALKAATGKDFGSISEAFSWHDIESKVDENGDCYPTRFIGKCSKEYGYRLPDMGKLFKAVARFIEAGGKVTIRAGTISTLRFRGDESVPNEPLPVPVARVEPPAKLEPAPVEDEEVEEEDNQDVPLEKVLTAPVAVAVLPVAPPAEPAPVPVPVEAMIAKIVAEKAPKVAKPKKALPPGAATVGKFRDAQKLAILKAAREAGMSWEKLELKAFNEPTWLAVGDPSYHCTPLASHPGTNMWEIGKREGWQNPAK